MRLPLEVGEARPHERRVLRDGGETALTAREAALLTYLARAKGPVPESELLVEVWGLRGDTRTHTVQTVVYTLRRKIERDPRHPRHLRTERGRGYLFEALQASPLASILDAADLLVAADANAAATALEAVLAHPARTHADSLRAALHLAEIRQRQGRLAAATRAIDRAPLEHADRITRGRFAVARGLVLARAGEASADAFSRGRAATSGHPLAEPMAQFNSHLDAPFDTGVLRTWEAMLGPLVRHGYPRQALVVAAALGAAHLALGRCEEGLAATAVVAGVVSAERPFESRVLLETEAALADDPHRWARATAVDPAGRRLDEPFGWYQRCRYVQRRDPGRRRHHLARLADAVRASPFTRAVASRM